MEKRDFKIKFIPIHCVTRPENEFTLCGEGNFTPALDLQSHSWQNALSRFPDDEYCPKCLSIWKDATRIMNDRQRFIDEFEQMLREKGVTLVK